jgi:hypothetical protein
MIARRPIPTPDRAPVRLAGVAGRVRSCRDLGCYSATLGRFCIGHARLIRKEG